MEDYEYKKVDFNNPSFMFTIEDMLKNMIGVPLFYNPYFKTFGLKGNENVLDFGCGGGSSSRALLKFLSRGGNLTAIDASDFWIKKARKRLEKYTNATFMAGDIRNLYIKDNLFDVISIIHVIHDISPEDRKDTVGAICRKLKQGGRIYIREPIKKSHGMPVDEIRALFNDCELREKDYIISKSEYRGIFAISP
ncbi:MAG: class I SAM-dependent methyltransferase [Actinobacteria bacterium]|nr:class I SAM-dependent methyltransferase [Actinomycetota bacterium]